MKLSMENKILNGKELAENLRAGLKTKLEVLKEKTGKTPGLAVLLIGDDGPSAVYVKNKETMCRKIGITSTIIKLPVNTEEKKVLEILENLNSDSEVDGILLQSPIPAHLNFEKLIEKIDPIKDVDCFHPFNIGLLFKGTPYLESCTPMGIITLLKEHKIKLSGKHAVIIGRSLIVGKPLAVMLLKENCTVTICHSKTENLLETCKSADILISAIGKANFIKREYVKPGAVVIDVGINMNPEGKLVGDVNFNEVVEISEKITPVPGGIGPMTILSLMQNCIKIFEKRNNL